MSSACVICKGIVTISNSKGIGLQHPLCATCFADSDKLLDYIGRVSEFNPERLKSYINDIRKERLRNL